MKAVFAASFDPFTNGHLHIYKQASEIFDDVHILFANNPEKQRFMPVEKMMKMVSDVVGNYTYSYDGLTADYCKQNNIKYLVRGLRNPNDYLHEEELAMSNAKIYPELKTIYLRADDVVISSTFVRTLYKHGKDVSEYIPKGIILG